MKNIVIMCDTYLPKASPNGICVNEVALTLVKRGDCVRIVTTPNIERQKEKEIINGVEVFRVNPGFVVRELNATEGKTDSASAKRRSRALKISGICGAVNGFRYPLSAPSQVNSYYKCACELHKKEKIDVIVCCYHKIAAVAAGIKFKKKFPDTKFVVYTLDAVSGGLVFPVLRNMKIPMNSLKRWEKKMFSTVDKAFVMESHRLHYDSREYDKYRDRLDFLDIPLVVSGRQGKDIKKDKVHFVYTGSMSIGTANPKHFLSILKMLDDCVFDIYGTINEDITEIIKNAQITDDKLMLHGRVPHEEISDIQREADILLNFGNANPCMIPCKIFEYISTGKKILSFTHSSTDSSLPYLEKYPNALIIDENDSVEDNEKKIKEFMSAPTLDVSENMLNNIYEKNTAAYFCNRIDLL